MPECSKTQSVAHEVFKHLSCVSVLLPGTQAVVEMLLGMAEGMGLRLPGSAQKGLPDPAVPLLPPTSSLGPCWQPARFSQSYQTTFHEDGWQKPLLSHVKPLICWRVPRGLGGRGGKWTIMRAEGPGLAGCWEPGLTAVLPQTPLFLG